MVPKRLEDKVAELHEKAIIIDAQNACIESVDYLEKIRGGGVATIRKNLGPHHYSLRHSLDEASGWYSKFEGEDSTMTLVCTAEDIRRAKREEKLGVILGTNSAKLFDDDLNMVKVFYRLGVRVVQLIYNNKDSLGDGCTERTNCGLSKLGLQMIEEMNRLGILVDLSHAGYATSMDAIEHSKESVSFTHSNPRALCDNPRNIPDGLIEACAEKGGVIGVNAYPAFVSKKLEPSPEDLLDHVDYLVKLVGVNHVGFGLDITEGHPKERFEVLIRSAPHVYPPWPWHFAISSASEFETLTAGLVARGYSDGEVLKLLGQNFLRLFEHVWRE